MDRSKGLMLLTIVVLATIFSGIALTAMAADSGDESTNELTTVVAETEEESNDDSAEFMPCRMMPGICGWSRGGFRRRGGLHGRGGFGFVEVSEEFEENVITLAESDEDVQALLDDGYNITGVRPIVKTVIDGDGNVVAKATDAIVMLDKDGTGKAGVWVDLEEGKVTKIVIVTRTVIEKP